MAKILAKAAILGFSAAAGYAIGERVNSCLKSVEVSMHWRETEVVAACERPELRKAHLLPEGAAQLAASYAYVGIRREMQLPEGDSEKVAARLPGLDAFLQIEREMQLPKGDSEKGAARFPDLYVHLRIRRDMQLPKGDSEKVPDLFTADIASSYEGYYEGYYKGKGVEMIEGTVVTEFGTDEHGNAIKAKEGGKSAKEEGRSIQEYDHPPYFYSRSFDLSCKFYGGK